MAPSVCPWFAYKAPTRGFFEHVITLSLHEVKGTAMAIAPLLALGASQVSSVDSRLIRVKSTLYWFVACTGFTQHARTGLVSENGSRVLGRLARAIIL